MNDGSEAQAEADFVAWLEARGWTRTQRVGHADVTMIRDGARLIGEVKGRTSSPGTDVDTMFGQLLRRVDLGQTNDVYAIAVPPELETAVRRVASEVLDALRISLFVIEPDGRVRFAHPQAPTV